LKAEVKRGDETKTLTLPLAEDWRRNGDIKWRPAMWPLRNWLVGFQTQPLTPQQRTDAGLADDAPGLRLERLTPDFVKERNQSPAMVGLKVGDVLIEIDGQKDLLKNEAVMLAYFVQKKKPDDTFKLTVLRSGQRKDFEVKLR
jgi:S1-C subfamily serine protease